ncbi:MAG: hypothetical protein MJY61_02725 [Bacteroidales bacterium]|nr:hypothetical protein [Bacteroidales bacterium]
MNEKTNRKNLIAEIIRTQKVHNQEELVKLLELKGVTTTQATLSRDTKEMGAFKVSDPVEGLVYALPSEEAQKQSSQISIDDFDISGQMCVLHCKPAFASVISSLIDGASIKGVMGTIAGDDTILLMLHQTADKNYISDTIHSMFRISEIVVRVATAEDTVYAEEICREIYVSSLERKTGIANRTPEYISEKILAGKAVIAVDDKGEFAGFSYIESWGHKSFVANSGLIVAHKFRGRGISKRIKEMTFSLSRTLYPNAKIFSITTGAAVMKMNYQLGFRPVPYSELTDDPEFWKGCEGCRHFEILKNHDYKACICTGLLYDSNEK